MVTGGSSDDVGYVDTTEVYDSNLGIWVTSGAKLPRPMVGLRATNIDGCVLIFGNYIFSFIITRSNRNIFAGGMDDDYHDDILEFKPDDDAIVPLGHMTQVRGWHAISVVKTQDYSNWCQ